MISQTSLVSTRINRAGFETIPPATLCVLLTLIKHQQTNRPPMTLGELGVAVYGRKVSPNNLLPKLLHLRKAGLVMWEHDKSRTLRATCKLMPLETADDQES